jgi:hypothetical protein
MLLNGAAQIEETATQLQRGCQFPWCALALSEQTLRVCGAASLSERQVKYWS